MPDLRRVVLFLALAATAVAGLSVASAGEDPAARGAAYLAPFKKDLMAALKTGIQNGPAAAIDACRIEAPAIADRYSRDDVRIGRSSHRLRNPDNATPDWVSSTLEAWLAGDAREPVVIEIDADRLGYIEPIATKPLCLTCHGETLTPAISERLDALYPDDEATGFDVGDLRGVFWVEFAP